MVFDQLTEKDIRNACGSTYYARGAQYYREGRVLDVDWDETLEFVSASVKGSGRHVYDVEISVAQDGNGIDIDGTCSCPVYSNCKHVVAALLEVVNLQRAEKNDLPVGASREKNDILGQWQQQALVTLQYEAQKYQNSDSPDCLLYVLKQDEYRVDNKWRCETFKSRILKSGGWGQQKKYDMRTMSSWYTAPAWFAQIDIDIASLLVRGLAAYIGIEIEGDFGHLAVQKMIASGRCYYPAISDRPLTAASPRRGEMLWQDATSGTRQLRLQIDGAGDNCVILPTQPPLYIDPVRSECGVVELPLSARELRVLQQLPPVAKNKLHDLGLFISQTFPPDTVPLPVELDIRSAAKTPVPLLQLSCVQRFDDQLVHVARVRFWYEPCECVPTVLQDVPDSNILIEMDGTHWSVEQNWKAEIEWIRQLTELGFVAATEAGVAQSGELNLLFTGATVEQSAARWKMFFDQMPQLEEQGWLIEIDDSFSMQFTTPDALGIHLDDSVGGWFEMGLDIEYNGQRLAMLPLLIRWLEQGGGKEPLLIYLEDGTWLHCPDEMISPIVATLVELFDGSSLNDDGQLKLHRSQIHQLSHIEQQLGDQVENLQWHGNAQLRELAHKLDGFAGIHPVASPPGLITMLRDYQSQGLAWLQFLREYQFNGILADDMGLGKTVQALAHLLVEKESGRMETPALIIAPTSVLSNWRREAQRFTPELRVLVLHGSQRSEYFDKLGEFDLIITSYALLNRDQEIHQQQCYHVFILDEAQAIKNPASKSAQAACSINAHQRLCLTGTPVENHLGELWSLFHFLMPGFLGSQKRFNKLFRKPIEQQSNHTRQQELQRRLLPFVLRRDKQQVASELPAKTTIICDVELGAAQTKLYETVRSAMSKKVRKLLEQKGLKNSHIEILDALLKLRQVCCDPRLVKLASAKNVQGSAKLDQLMAMLEQQLEEGRKILLFSQFTSMLSLIEEELAARSIAYTKLTGSTRKRDEVIARFQNGEVPLFLISLKAGGVGLNLIAADTVIHYDPWWNPAVENQATDRAHRIGQDKPVFVYKMIAQGTVEEKIVQLQEKKQRLADGVYAGDKQQEVTKLTGDDLLALLEG